MLEHFTSCYALIIYKNKCIEFSRSQWVILLHELLISHVQLRVFMNIHRAAVSFNNNNNNKSLFQTRSPYTT